MPNAPTPWRVSTLCVNLHPPLGCIRFKDISSDGKIYCFETIEKYYSGQETKVTILAHMPTEQTLRIGKLDAPSCDQGPWQIDNFVEFVR